MRWQLKSVIVMAGIGVCVGMPARAWDAGGDPLKAQIDKLLDGIATATNGVVTWDGADTYQVTQDGAASVAVITHARMSIHGKELAQLAFDRIGVRREPDPNDNQLVDFAITLPTASTLTMADGSQVKLTLNDAKANIVVEAQAQATRETSLSLTSARLEEAKSGAWVNFGPLTSSSKVIADGKGGFTGPGQLDWQKIEFSIPTSKVGGTIDRLAYSGKAAGPSLSKLEELRAQLEELRQSVRTPEEKKSAVFDIVTAMVAAYSQLQGEFEVDGVAVRDANGPVVTLAKASIGEDLSGLDGDNAALRVTIKQDGLDLAPTLLPPDKVPHRVVFDLGVEKVSTAALRAIAAAATKMDGSEAEKMAATQQMMGAAATLAPTLHIYDIAADTQGVGIDITATASGSPISPQGYTADGDVVVRGFAELPTFAAGAPMLDYLPLLQMLGTEENGPDGSPRIKFHLGSAPPKWITVNGNDVSGWILDTGKAPGQRRLLRPAAPPLRGTDVGAVQQALAVAGMAVPRTGAYDGPTAVAVARFQKQNGMNVNGVVDAATWQKLGVKAEATPMQPSPGTPSAPAPGPHFRGQQPLEQK